MLETEINDEMADALVKLKEMQQSTAKQEQPTPKRQQSTSRHEKQSMYTHREVKSQLMT